MGWSVGATGQDEQPFDYSDPELIRVKQIEVVVTKWVQDEN